MTNTSLTDPQNDYFIITLPVAETSEVVVVEEDATPALTAYENLVASLAAAGRIELRRRGKYDESKHKRGKGGRFAPKSGGGGGKIDYKKKTAKKAPPPPPEPEPEAAPKISYKKTAKKAPPPPPAKKAATPPPPAKKTAPAAKKTVGKKTAPPPPPPVDDLDDLLDEPATPTSTPTPANPVVPVTSDVEENLELSDGTFAAAGDRVLVNGRAGTVRGDEVGADGLTETLHVQFDDDPTSLSAVSASDAQIIEDVDNDDYADILKQPYGPEVAGLEPGAAPASSSGASSDTPFPISPGFETLTHDEASDMQLEMTANDPWTATQEDALVTYSGDSYTDMNRCLRFDEDCTDEVEDDNVNASAGMRPTTRATTTFRGVNLRALGANSSEQLQGMVGAVVRDHGFTSSSISTDSAFNNEVTMQIDVPEGTPAAYIEDISQNPGEYELLLNSGTRFEIMAVNVDENGHSNVHVRVVP